MHQRKVMWACKEKVAVYRPRRGTSPKANHAGIPISDFQSQELWKNIFWFCLFVCFFVCLFVCLFFMAAQVALYRVIHNKIWVISFESLNRTCKDHIKDGYFQPLWCFEIEYSVWLILVFCFVLLLSFPKS